MTLSLCIYVQILGPAQDLILNKCKHDIFYGSVTHSTGIIAGNLHLISLGMDSQDNRIFVLLFSN